MSEKEQQPIKIVTPPMSAFGTEIQVGDQKISRVKSVRFEHVAGEAPKLFIEIIAIEGLAIDGFAEVETKNVEPEIDSETAAGPIHEYTSIDQQDEYRRFAVAKPKEESV